MAVFTNVSYPVGTIAVVTFVELTATVGAVFTFEGVLNGTINGPSEIATLTLNGTDFQIVSTSIDQADQMVFQFGDDFIIISNTPLTEGQEIPFSEVTFGDYVVPCFAAGTRILTRRGEVAVEDLQVGDQAMALRSGGFSTISWIGQRQLSCAAGSKQAEKWPLRVRAGAFGDGKPHRDLFLSPDHAVHVNGVLVPIRYLENGVTVVRAPREEVTYFHIELDRHDLLIAEGLATESYLDTGNRQDFEGVARTTTFAERDERKARQIWAEKSCLPLHVSGPAVAEARAMLMRRAAEMGLGSVVEPELRLRVGGRDILPTPFGEGWHFELPQLTAGAKLLSIAHVPAVTAAGSSDYRCLGVPVTRMMVDGRPVSPSAPFLKHGWHPPEDDLRWTTGLAQLPPLRTLTLLLAPIVPGGSTVRNEDASPVASAA